MISWKKYIVCDPQILLGKPIIKGTRISVENIIEKLAEGETIEQILESYPHISKKEIYSCLSYASDILHNENVYSLAS